MGSVTDGIAAFLLVRNLIKPVMEMVIPTGTLRTCTSPKFRALKSLELTLEGIVHTCLGSSTSPSITDVVFEMITSRSSCCMKLLCIRVLRLKSRIFHLTCTVKSLVKIAVFTGESTLSNTRSSTTVHMRLASVYNVPDSSS